MSVLAPTTLQRLACLWTICKWPAGPFGLFRLVKTIYGGERTPAQPHVFEYHRNRYGQYSGDVARAVDQLTAAGLVMTRYDGDPENAGRIEPHVTHPVLKTIDRAICSAVPNWAEAVDRSFEQHGFAKTAEIEAWVQALPEYRVEIGTEYFPCTLPDGGMDAEVGEDEAEFLTDLVDPHAARVLRASLSGERGTAWDWRAELAG